MASTLDPVAVEDIHGDRRWLSQVKFLSIQ